MQTFPRPLVATLAAASALVFSTGPVSAQANAGDGPKEVESLLTDDAGPISVRPLATGLEHPWGMAFLPDGRLLVTERAGRLRVMSKDNQIAEPVRGVPPVRAQGQGGLLDVALDPDFADNRYVYLSYSKPGAGNTATPALGRGVLSDDATSIENFADIFVAEPYVDGPNHFGNRIVFDGGGHLFLTLGERFQFDPAQGRPATSAKSSASTATAPCPTTTRSSATRMPARRSTPGATATSRRRRSTRPPADCRSRRWARSAATS